MEMFGKVLKLKNSDAVSVHHTTQYKKLRQDVTDDERDDEEDDVVFLRKGIELKQQNGFEVDHTKLVNDSNLDLRPSRKSRLPSDHIQVKQGGARKRASLKKRPAYLLLTVIVSMVTISALVAFHLHKLKTKISRSWIQEFVDSEGTSNVVLYDVDGDGIQDIIISIATSENVSSARLDKRTSSQSTNSLCSLKGNRSPCSGRLVAMRGHDGEFLWETSVPYGLTTIKCGVIDADRDKSLDCIASGSFASLMAFSASTGHVIWTGNFTTFHSNWQVVGVDVLTDLNGDGVVDLVAMVTMQTKQDAMTGVATNKTERRSALLSVDGLTGNVLGRPIGVKGSSTFSPLVQKFKDRSIYVVFGTGSSSEAGSLFALSLREFYSAVMSSETKKPLLTTDLSTFKVSKTHFNDFDVVGGIMDILRNDRHPGVVVRPLFVDFDKDGSEDMLVASCNGNVSLFTGANNRILWSLSFSEHHVTREMVHGYFNDDEYPDVLLYLNLKPHTNITAPSSVMVVLSGSTGSLIWSVNDTAVEFSARNLVTSTSETNRDFFLLWLKRQTSLEEDAKRHKRHVRNSGMPLPRRSKVFPKMRSRSPPYEDYFSYNRRPYLYDGGNAYVPGGGVDYHSASEYGVDPDQPLSSRSRPYPPEYYNHPDEADDYRGGPSFRNLHKSTKFSTSKSTKTWTTTISPSTRVECRSTTEHSFLVGMDRYSTEDPFILSQEEAFRESLIDVEGSSKDLLDSLTASKSKLEPHICLSAVIQSTSSALGDVDGDRKADLVSMTSFMTTEINQNVDRSTRTTKKLLVSKTNLQTKISDVIRSRLESLNSPFLIPSLSVSSPLKASRTMAATDLSRYVDFRLASPEAEFQTNQ